MKIRFAYFLPILVSIAGLAVYLITSAGEVHPLLAIEATGLTSPQRVGGDSPAHRSATLEVPRDTERGSAVAVLETVARELETRRVFEQDDRTLEQKYAGATRGQLLAAASLLEERRNSERGRIAKEIIAGNRLSVTTLQRDGSGSPPLASGPDGRPVSMVQIFDSVDGVPVVKTAIISGEEYPDYRALELEVWWLHSKLIAAGDPEQVETK